jgi:outer membrane immunogenic protein
MVTGQMNRIWLAAALAALPLPGAAADIQRQVVQPAPAGAVWSGPYVGLNLGYLSSNVGLLAARPRGISGGIQAGYNWQSGPVVFGGEADVQASAAEDTFAPFKFSNPWFGTVRGRLGYASEPPERGGP